MLYINSLDLLILHEFNIVLFDQYLTLSHPTQPLGSTILFPETMYEIVQYFSLSGLFHLV